MQLSFIENTLGFILKMLFTSFVVVFLGVSQAYAQDPVDEAAKLLGTPYLFGGDSTSGIDCSALTRRAYKVLEVTLPRTSLQQSQLAGEKISLRSGLIRGDLVFFATGSNQNLITHVGIFVGGNVFINAQTVRGVTYDNLEATYWKPKFKFGLRITKLAQNGVNILLRPWKGGNPGNPNWSYAMAYGGGGGEVAGSSANPWAWETWVATTNGGGPIQDGSYVCLRSQSGLYLSTNGSWCRARADRQNVFGWEWFYVRRERGPGIVRSGDRVSLMGWQGMYLGANYNYSDAAVGCFYPFGGWGSWECWTLVVK